MNNNWKDFLKQSKKIIKEQVEYTKENVSSYIESEDFKKLKQKVHEKIVPKQKDIELYQENIKYKYEDIEQKSKNQLSNAYQIIKEQSQKLQEKLIENNDKQYHQQKSHQYTYDNKQKSQKFDFNKFFNGYYFNQKINKTGRTFGFYFLSSIFLYSLGSNIPYAFIHYIQYKHSKRQFNQQLEMQGLLEQKQ